MRSALLLLVTVVLLVPSPAQAKGKLCDDRPGETVAATSVVRVYRDLTNLDSPVLRGCRHGSRVVTRLAPDGDCSEDGSVTAVDAAGRFVALARSRCDTITGNATVVLFDLKTGRNVLGTSAYSGDLPSSTTSTEVSALDVSLTGALAWIGTGGALAELHLRRAGTTAPEVIDSGTDLSDLAVTAHKVFWLNGGQTKSADLEVSAQG